MTNLDQSGSNARNRLKRKLLRLKKTPTGTGGKIPSGLILPSREVLREQFEQLSRSPFKDELARIMLFAPKNSALMRFANKNPDRWGQLVAMFSRMSGYTEKLVETRSTILMAIHEMSDAEIARELNRMANDRPMIELNPSGSKGEVIEATSIASPVAAPPAQSPPIRKFRLKKRRAG